MSAQIEEEIPQADVAVLSGPSHAEEVGRKLPTTCVIGAKTKKTAEYLQSAFINKVFRVYTSPDILGIELGGSLKNVIAKGMLVIRHIRISIFRNYFRNLYMIVSRRFELNISEAYRTVCRVCRCDCISNCSLRKYNIVHAACIICRCNLHLEIEFTCR